MSPGRVCEVARAPARISTTAKPRQDPTIRRPGTFSAARTTLPSREAMRMSIGNRMKNVWTMLLGAMMRAWPGGNPSRPSRPRLREAESKAGSSLSATTRPVRSFRRTSGGASRRVRARRKCDFRACLTRFQGLSDAISGFIGEDDRNPHPVSNGLPVPKRRPELPRLGGGHEHALLEASHGRHQLHALDISRFVDDDVEIAGIVARLRLARQLLPRYPGRIDFPVGGGIRLDRARIQARIRPAALMSMP